MISVADALAGCLKLAKPLQAEEVPLIRAAGRVLARDAVARRDQPPFAASAMDGYGLRAAEAAPGATFRVVGEAAAGHRWEGSLSQGEALRIFTGAPVPEGVDRVVIQEDTTRDGDTITLGDTLGQGDNIRPAGGDFRVGDTLRAPRRLKPADVALAASMNLPRLSVTRRPVIAVIATGDELVQPGDDPGPDQIVASNSYGIAALIEAEGGEARLLPIARDSEASLRTILDLAQGADMIVTIGGASVGDHDLVGQVAVAMGLERTFYKVAMRPGKPLMAGRLGAAALLGLPGNPVSAMVCAHLFLVPMLRAYLGLPAGPRQREQAVLAEDVPANGPREHYMRAVLRPGTPVRVAPAPRQDSSLLTVLADAHVLLIRPPDDGPRAAGEPVDILRL